MRLLLIVLALVVAACPGDALSEKLVFQGNPVAHYGFDVDDDPTHAPCPSPYDSEECIDFQRTEFANDYLGKTLPNDKHAYRVRFWIFAGADFAQSKFRCMLSFKDGTATVEAKGDGHHTGAWGESVQVVFEENSVGWDVKLVEVSGENYQEIATGSEPRDSSAWRRYDLRANTDTGDVSLINDAGTVMASAKLLHHQGKAITSQWYRGTGGSWYTSNTYLRASGDSTAVYDQDPRPPIIGNLTQTPNLVAPGQAVKVSAVIRDDWGLATAVLHSWTKAKDADTFTPAADVAMQNLGAQHYEATLPPHTDGVVVRYQIEATAVSGLKATSTTIEYEVGSSDPPKDLGGGSGFGATGNTFMVATIGFAILAAIGVVAGLFMQGVDKRQSANWVAAGLIAGAAWFGLAFILDDLAAFFTGPWGIPLAIIFAIIAGVVIAARRKRGVKA
ncbi:MAG: hypothetical protein LC623_02265 [Halobacteriales archaeon]|nr:hypothetical protein [Halobacteriales archaeon]